MAQAGGHQTFLMMAADSVSARIKCAALIIRATGVNERSAVWFLDHLLPSCVKPFRGGATPSARREAARSARSTRRCIQSANGLACAVRLNVLDDALARHDHDRDCDDGQEDLRVPIAHLVGLCWS